MPSPTIILGILLAIALAALTGAGALLKSSWEQNAKLEIQYINQQAETQKAISDLNSVKLLHLEQITEMSAELKERQRDVTDLRKQSQTIRGSSNRLEQALKREPVRAGRVTTILNARGLRDICRASGGTAADCKISLLKPAKARSSDTAAGGSGADPVLGNQTNTTGKPSVHPKSRLGEHESFQ